MIIYGRWRRRLLINFFIITVSFHPTHKLMHTKKVRAAILKSISVYMSLRGHHDWAMRRPSMFSGNYPTAADTEQQVPQPLNVHNVNKWVEITTSYYVYIIFPSIFKILLSACIELNEKVSLLYWFSSCDTLYYLKKKL